LVDSKDPLSAIGIMLISQSSRFEHYFLGLWAAQQNRMNEFIRETLLNEEISNPPADLYQNGMFNAELTAKWFTPEKNYDRSPRELRYRAARYLENLESYAESPLRGTMLEPIPLYLHQLNLHALQRRIEDAPPQNLTGLQQHNKLIGILTSVGKEIGLNYQELREHLRQGANKE
jgi:hypothetical protein